MNILVIGNGFDLAHDLKTSYIDFLHFTQYYSEYESSSLFSEEIENLIKDNAWLEFFYNIEIGKGWIDFEKEISDVIKSLNAVYKMYYDNKYYDKPIEYVNSFYEEKLGEFGVDYDQLTDDDMCDRFKNKLLNDLNRLTRCLEIYLLECVENIDIAHKLKRIDELKIGSVLSFNYTHTFEKLYGINKKIKYDYIHGEAKKNSSVDACNMILGIDEYLDDLQRNTDTKFIEFKKFYQRIYKGTGCKYADWINEIENYSNISRIGYDSFNNVYIIGHSLDITDGDVIKSLITMSNTRTMIYYHNKEALGRYISNLVKILGENQLISMTYGENARVVFREQSELCGD